MALMYTPNDELGTPLPKFELPDVFGKSFSSKDLKSKPAKLIVFICAHCPYVQAIEDRLIELGKQLNAMNVPMFGICSNDATDYPEDSPSALRKRAELKKYSFPYLIDESQEVAKSFGAICTPDFFVYDHQDNLRYRGRLDDSWKNPDKVTNPELLEAIKLLVKKQTLKEPQHPSMGCSIKWK